MADYINEEIKNGLIEASELFGKDVVSKLITQLKRLNKVARGRLIDSLNYKLMGALTGIAIDFEAEDYIIYVNDGRKPGKFAPVSAIKDWCKAKGIDEKYVYPINLKIKRVGIAPTKFIEEVFNDSTINDYISKIEDIGSKKVENTIEITFKNQEFKIK